MAVAHQIHNPQGGIVDVTLSAATAIKAFCTECMGHQISLVRGCTSIHCPLWPFRGTSMAYLGARAERQPTAAQLAVREKFAEARRFKDLPNKTPPESS